MTPPRLLTIAGSDSGGGAGIQADLKTFAALETYGMSVITAITAQNTLGVQGPFDFWNEGITPEMVSLQLHSVVSDIGVDAIKLGMLFSADTIESITTSFSSLFPSRSDHPPIVLDPVCVSTSGHSLLPSSALSILKSSLIPWATILTPNIPEAQLLSSFPREIKTIEDMKACASKLGELGAEWVYLKGGHLPMEKEEGGKVVVDLLWGRNGEWVVEERKWIESRNTHGTGCSLSAAIAANLGKGMGVKDAVRIAGDYVSSAIASSYPIGAGSGPINHFHGMLPRSILLPTPTSPTPFTDYLIAYAPDAWRRYVYHPFPLGLADGTLPLKSFLHFIQQDYHFLKQYARTNALAAYKTTDMIEMAASMEITNAVIKETEMHVKVFSLSFFPHSTSLKLIRFLKLQYCEKYSISRAELLAVPESITSVAYTRYVLDISSKGDLLDTRVVTAPCLIGYGHVGARLVAAKEGVDRSEKNEYWSWIEEYGGEWFQGAVKTGIDLLEKTVVESPISEKRLRELAEVFKITTELEIAFWDAAMDAA
ncbi:hydroxymethylpyrimidine/phosphomethylpyrimidine kinase / thiaminase, partial [Phenoliferia sp. Uapishka_3]